MPSISAPVSSLADWTRRCTSWLDQPAQQEMEQLRASLPGPHVPQALRFLMQRLRTPGQQTPGQAALLGYYIAVDHQQWIPARAFAGLLRRGILPEVTAVRLAVALETKADAPAAAWEILSTWLDAGGLPDVALTEIWYRLSEAHLTDADRYSRLEKWMQLAEPLRNSPIIWLKAGNLAVFAGALQAAINSFLQGCRTWLENPEVVPPSRPKPVVDYGRCQEDLFHLLADAHRAGLELVPMGGTLLGLERNGCLLPGDKDADLVCPGDQLQAVLSWLAAKGWRRLQRRPALANYYSFAHSSFPLALDLFPRFREVGRDTLLSGWWIAGGKQVEGRFTRLPPFQLILKPTLAGDIVYPANADEILTAIYDDWRMPDPDFDTVVMAHHLVGFTPMVASYALQRLLIALMEGRRAKATRYAQTLIARGFNADLARALLARLEAASATGGD